MRLPNAERAIVEREKIVDYLLNSAHPDNGGKAQFFFSLGFREAWQGLRDASIGLAQRRSRNIGVTARYEVYSRRSHRVAERRRGDDTHDLDRGSRAGCSKTGNGLSTPRTGSNMIKEHERVVLK